MEIGNRVFAGLEGSRGNGSAEVTAGELDGRRGAANVHEGGKILVRAAKCVGNPASESRVIKLPAAMAGAGLYDRGKMIALVAPQGTNDSDIVDAAADMRKPIGDGDAGFAVAREGAQAADHRALHFGEVVAEADGVDEFSGVFVVLGIEGIDVADAAAHEKEDNGPGLRLLQEGGGNFLRLGKEAAERQSKKSTPELVNKATARVAAAW